MPAVSIIMPVYNKEKYLTRTIQSILNQTFKDFELIIIDDGSIDSSLSICELFSEDKRIKIIKVENGGVSRARNIGLDNASGEYILFIDADDYIDVSFIQNLYNIRGQFVVGGITRVSKDKKTIDIILPKHNGNYSFKEILPTFYKEQLESGIYGFVASKLILKNIIDKYNIRFNEKISLAEDYEFFLSVYENIDEICFTHNSGYFYVQETDNSSILMSDENINFFHQIQIQKKAYNFLNSRNSISTDDYQKYLKLVTGYIYTIFINYKNTNYGDFKCLFTKVKKEVPNVYKQNKGFIQLFIYLYDKNYQLLFYILLKLKKYLGGKN